MRNIIALIATLTLSSASVMSIMACGDSNASQIGTNNIFHWKKTLNETNKTAEEVFNFLLSNPNNGWGNDLYKKVNDYVNLSILKNDPKYSNDYAAALIMAKSQKDNMIESIKAQFGTNWEKQWNKFLKEKDNGGGSVEGYIDTILQKSATNIINRSYVSQNYQDYKYYSKYEISIWLADIWKEVKTKQCDSVADYIEKERAYAKKVWIVANATTGKSSLDLKFEELNKLINKPTITSWTEIAISIPVVKTVNDEEGGTHVVDTYKSIDGLLSDNQIKIAKVMLRNQQPIWTRQIVIPFSDEVTKPLQSAINTQQFDKKDKINKIIADIRELGFDHTFNEHIKGVTTSGDITKSGDLGLLNIADGKGAKLPFYYYLYRFVTSVQGVGKNNIFNVSPYKLKEFVPNKLGAVAGYDYFAELLPLINRTLCDVSNNASNRFNDLVCMKDADIVNSELPKSVDNNGPGIGIFIDVSGIHFIQTPGITYQPSVQETSTFDLIKTYKSNESTTDVTWEQLEPLANRQGGLASTPYLSYLQTVYLLQKHKKYSHLSFDLNNAITKFTAAGDVKSPNWWDYNLYFNKNIDLIHWNLQNITGSQLTGDDEKIQKFVEKVKGWFIATLTNRWNNKQGINIDKNFSDSVKSTNESWDGFSDGAPVARLDENITAYINICRETLWWYDPSIIKN